jgi:hypothetical protein
MVAALAAALKPNSQLRLNVHPLKETQLRVVFAHALTSQIEMLHFEIERGVAKAALVHATNLSHGRSSLLRQWSCAGTHSILAGLSLLTPQSGGESYCSNLDSNGCLQYEYSWLASHSCIW